MPETVQHFPRNNWSPQDNWYPQEDEWRFVEVNVSPWRYSNDCNGTGGLLSVYPNNYSINYTAPSPIVNCKMCVNYEGDCKCALNIFIAAEGVDMGKCWGFEEGRVCRHCGGRT